jgi:hypothetical protein
MHSPRHSLLLWLMSLVFSSTFIASALAKRPKTAPVAPRRAPLLPPQAGARSKERALLAQMLRQVLAVRLFR